MITPEIRAKLMQAMGMMGGGVPNQMQPSPPTMGMPSNMAPGMGLNRMQVPPANVGNVMPPSGGSMIGSIGAPSSNMAQSIIQKRMQAPSSGMSRIG